MTLPFSNSTSHGDGGPSVQDSSGSVDVSNVRSHSITKPDSPGCESKKDIDIRKVKIYV